MEKLNQKVGICLQLSARCKAYMYEQNFHAGLGALKGLSVHLAELSQLLLVNTETLAQAGYVINMDEYAGILSGILSAQECHDYILVADLLELQLVPFLYEIQQSLIALGELLIDDGYFPNNLSALEKRDKKLADRVRGCKDSGNLILEPTSSGYLTLKVQDGSGAYYFHSNVNPYVASDVFAKQYYNENQNHYVVLGLGLAYHILALVGLDDGIYIDIMEPDLEVIKCACEAVDLSWLFTNERITLYYDPEFRGLQEKLNSDGEFVVHQPTLRHIQDEKIRLAVDKFFVRDSGIRNFKRLFQNNFRENVVHCNGYVDELKERFEGKNAIVVAAGPSLDRNIHLLRNLPDHTVVVAVGTVFRKMIQLGIEPDYVVFLDAQKHMIHQIAGLEDKQIPIIVSASACKGLAMHYQGPKYLVCQEGYDKAVSYAGERGYQVYASGGSVSTIALDICLRLGCKEVAYIGLDLAYTGGLSHATATLDYCETQTDDMVEIEGYDGGKVPATKLFLIYKEWIEKRAVREDAKGKVIDATEGGAFKRGLRKQTLEETLQNWKAVC